LGRGETDNKRMNALIQEKNHMMMLEDLEEENDRDVERPQAFDA
jgi:hypothetical protein